MKQEVNFESIHNNIKRCIPFTEDELNIFDTFWEYKTFKKKTFLLKEGEISNYDYFLIKGVIRIFYIDEKGQEINLNFSIEDWWFGDVLSFNERIPSLLYIQTLEDCEVLRINFENKEKLLDQVPKYERVVRLMIQKHLGHTQRRLIKNIVQNAEEKYLDFLKQYPNLSSRIPQHYIASYLGITPEFLSKTRKKITLREKKYNKNIKNHF